ncbi:MAG: HPr family phosphocarrier protein [Lachnospiraceae bacterium]|nr:HPr family phosphocarrier protein [Robinsoniella sp.]MDY3767001.1 HPr family phosphocarrier protein [Lachnospiraceae bacterium]
MSTCDVRLNTISKIKEFVETLRAQEGNFTLSSGRYCIDAKSIMGIFSLDLSKPVHLTAESGNIPAEVKAFMA